ncbi:hypothetical protein [Aureibacter tunicatorum]|uniref:Uncharacterized protein n=1 Tax=Aureibacter tunicatorum TaxID=866807 RepID=A0AAE3XR94_9BACT|nr:hypothetical protein [Aureibacter tunicatorum]MDR6240465.1 hypothetical protein [Aureibacter tunicatorum]BDD05656.1 hypothetical protein AUTU_31390 [Aureibacter tunicatorum]
MHTIEHFGNWMNLYNSSKDPNSPFYGKEVNYDVFQYALYDHYIAPGWDSFGSETLYLKVLFADYMNGFVIIELIGEWNDAVYNDISVLKNEVIDFFLEQEINHFILIGENVFNFHGSDDSYYEEWDSELEGDGWIVALNFRDFILQEWERMGLSQYLFYGEFLDLPEWRTLTPLQVYKKVLDQMNRLIS